MEVYVSFIETGSYSDYSMGIEGVFDSLENAKNVFSQEPLNTYGRGLKEWDEWKEYPNGEGWSQELVKDEPYMESPVRTVIKCNINEQWT